MIAEADKVVIRSLFRGTHQGEFFGVPPTGKQVETPVIVIYQVAGDKIAQFWMQADVMGLMQQLTSDPATT
jgi:predicted ester cyclase